MRLDISVVTPVRDDPELIHALRSVPTSAEYIVVLTCAPEHIKKIVKDFQHENRPDMIIREVDIVGMSAGVNLGVDVTSNDKIAILDSDCTLTIDTLRAYSKALESSDFVRGITKNHCKDFWSSFSGLGQEELNRVFLKKARLIGPSIAFRKKLFLKLGGYDLEIGGSCDHEFALRIEDAGYITAFEPEAIVWHTAITLRIDVRSHFGYGKGMRSIDIKRGGHYGFGVCIDRWALDTMWRKFTQRGATSLLRTFLLGMIMLVGYIYQSYQYWKTNK